MGDRVYSAGRASPTVDRVQYGFAIDQRTCIGCHACTVACKTEHNVPVGQFRTWVKYVDSGQFPETSRDFGVMRCNHCTDAPCVQICPTEALFKREDGIVDFDNSACIGCKACMQACPYDAIYVDADTNTAAKCNFCAHRVDDGLEPACVVVCPTESIWVGDLDDPDSAISQFIATEETLVRSPEQGTGPNVHYAGASPAVLDPVAAPVDDTYIWAQPDTLRLAVAPTLRGDGSDPDAPRTTLNTAHPAVWGWKVTTYLWTKGVAAGAMLLPALAWLLGLDTGATGAYVAPVLAMAGLLATAVLLIADLKRPERFFFLLTKAHWTSWLVKGGVVLVAGAALAGAWFLYAVVTGDGPPGWLLMPAAVAAVLVAGYTAFLFGQAEGRDLWQSPLLFPHLIVQALMVGGGALLPVAVALDADTGWVRLLAGALLVGAVGHLGLAVREVTGRHSSANASAAARLIGEGPHRGTYRLGLALSAVAALTAALALVVGGGALGLIVALVAGGTAQVALLAWEHVFVRAAQEVPLS